MCYNTAHERKIALRVDDIPAFRRTFHPDEANQAFTTGRLIETGAYTYNPADHHGPTLYYAAGALQKAAGHGSTAELDATLLRCTPLIFAVLALVFGFLAVKKITKRSWPGILFALLLGTSPIFVFFSTDFIQEMLLVSFTMAMLWAATNYLIPGGRLKPGSWAILFGISSGLAFATKETSILTFAAAGTAAIPLVAARRREFRFQPRDAVLAIAGFALTATLLFSSFCTNWQGVYNAFVAAPLSYLHRAAGSAASQGAAAHVHPWWQYLKWLFAPQHGCGELLMLVPIVAAACLGAFRRPSAIFAASCTAVLALLYSAIPYKTPWCALQIHVGLCLAATLSIVFMAESAQRWRSAFACCAILFTVMGHCVGIAHLNRDPDSKDIPYNYASASPQVKELASLVIEQAAGKSETNSFVAVALPPEDTWPLPFYLRAMNARIGYWTSFGELEALAGLGVKPNVVVVPAEEGHLVQPLFPHLKNTKRFEMRSRIRVRAFW